MRIRDNLLLFVILLNTFFPSKAYCQQKETLEKRTNSDYSLKSEENFFEKALNDFFTQTSKKGKKRIYTQKEAKEIIQNALLSSFKPVLDNFTFIKKGRKIKKNIEEKCKIKYSNKKNLELNLRPELDPDFKNFLEQASIRLQAKVYKQNLDLDYDFLNNSASFNWNNSSLFLDKNTKIGFSAKYDFKNNTTECFLELKLNF